MLARTKPIAVNRLRHALEVMVRLIGRKKMEPKNQFGHPAVKVLILCLICLTALSAAAQDKLPINRVKEMLQAGKVTIGPIVMIPSGPVASLLSRSGFDWLWIDMEHGAISIETAQYMIDATKGSSTVPLVRIPWNHHWLAKPALDAGAMGVITPLVNTKEEAALSVAALRYPPEGVRGFGPLSFAAARWGLSVPEYTKVANKEILAIVQIEDIEAVNRIDEILSVPGIDLVFVGMVDLSGSMGLLGQTSHSEVEEAAQKVLAAAKRSRIPAGIMALTPDEINKRIEEGFQFIAVTSDALMLESAAKRLLKWVTWDVQWIYGLIGFNKEFFYSVTPCALWVTFPHLRKV
jgi:2-keto-3-deoxy-L-rhamnonate aldolase RhmA